MIQWGANCHARQPISEEQNRREPPTFVACIRKENIRQLGRLQRAFPLALAPAPGLDEL